MEIVTSVHRPRPSFGARVLVCLCVAVPVSLLALLPVGLGLQRVVLAGSGMEPAIPRGSVLLERPVPVAALRVGDVITFRPSGGSGGGLVTQRVVATRGRDVRTADASPDPRRGVLPLDAPAPARVVTSVPYVGHAYLVLGRPTVVLSLLAVSAGAGLVLVAGRRRRRDARDPRPSAGKVGAGPYAA